MTVRLYDENSTTLDSPDSDDEYCLDGAYYDRETAVGVAKAILTHEGETIPDTNAVLASSVSFNEALMRLAAAHGRIVSFSYAKGDQTVIEPRRLKPESVQTVGDHVTFIGYDPDRDDVRAYRVDRIKGEVSVA